MRTPVQHRWWHENACFGCGPQNPEGLHLQSRETGDGLEAEWHPEAKYQGPPGVVNGGMMSVPMDCHATWTAMLTFMRAHDLPAPPPTVTAGYSVTLRRPTPVGARVRLVSRPDEVTGRKVKVHVDAEVDGEVTATFDGTFVMLEGEVPG